MIGNLFENFGEAVYAMSMIWTTIVSVSFMDFSLKGDYKFYYSIGENLTLILVDILNYKPAGMEIKQYEEEEDFDS